MRNNSGDAGASAMPFADAGQCDDRNTGNASVSQTASRRRATSGVKRVVKFIANAAKYMATCGMILIRPTRRWIMWGSRLRTIAFTYLPTCDIFFDGDPAAGHARGFMEEPVEIIEIDNQTIKLAPHSTATVLKYGVRPMILISTGFLDDGDAKN